MLSCDWPLCVQIDFRLAPVLLNKVLMHGAKVLGPNLSANKIALKQSGPWGELFGPGEIRGYMQRRTHVSPDDSCCKWSAQNSQPPLFFFDKPNYIVI